MIGSIDTHDGEDGFSAIELPRTIKAGGGDTLRDRCSSR